MTTKKTTNSPNISGRNPLALPQIHSFIKKDTTNDDEIEIIEPVKKSNNKDDNTLIRRGFDITVRTAREIKIKAVMDNVRDYEIVQDALNQYFGF